MTLIIVLGMCWIYAKRPLQIHFTAQSLLPNFHDQSLWVSLTGIVLSFCGMEIATVHAKDVRNPQRDFPKALFWSTLIIVGTLLGGALAIAIVIPYNQINLVAGNMQAFDAFFSAYHVSWILPLIAIGLVLGGLGSVSNWIIAPTRGLLVAARDGNLPQSLQQENRQGAPKAILIYQAIIVSLLTMVFLLLPSVNGSYWFLTALTSQLYMLMYILMFAAAIVLRKKNLDQASSFRIPGGKLGMYLIAGMGILACLVTIAVGFIPPSGVQIGSLFRYEALLVIGLALMCLPPFITYRLRRSHWQMQDGKLISQNLVSEF
jgi:amino acid transporter